MGTTAQTRKKLEKWFILEYGTPAQYFDTALWGRMFAAFCRGWKLKEKETKNA